MKNLKKIFALITVICMLASTMTVVFADETTSSLLEGFKKAGFKMAGDFYYEIATEPTGEANGTAKIVSLTENNYNNLTTLNIPATVTIDEKDYDVVEIADSAFFKDDAIYDSNGDGEIISADIKENGEVVKPRDAWKGEIFGSDYASKITAINFAKNNKVTRIGNSALVSTKLVNAVFADNITKFGYNNFYNYSTIEYVHLPANLTNSGVGGALFTNCHNLKTIELPTNAGFTKIPSKFLRNCTLENLVVPDNVTSVATDAFVVSGYTTTTVENVYGTSSNAVVQSIANDIKAEDGTATKQYATNFDTYDFGDGTCAVTGIKDTTSLKGAVYMPEELNGKKVTAMMYDEGRFPLDSNVTDGQGRQKVTNANAPHLFLGESNITEFYMADTVEHIMYRQASNGIEYKDVSGITNGLYVETNDDGSVKCKEPIKDETWSHYYSIFYNCSKLEKLHLSDNLTGRVRGLLPTTTLVKEIEIPDGVTIIDRCFRKQTNLKSIRTTENSKLQKIIGGGNGSFDGCAGIEEFVILGSELEQFNPFYLIATTREDVITKNPNLTIFTANEEYAASTAILGMFANSYNFKISTDVDTQIMVDKVETSESGVTANLRSRAYGFNKSAEGEDVRVICAVYNSNDTLAKIDMVETGYDFTNSLIQTVTFDGVTVADDQNVKVFVWNNTGNAAPATDVYDLKGDKRSIKYYAVGHSYLRHSPFYGWQAEGIWGMAATSWEKDYFRQFQKDMMDNFDCNVIALDENHSAYERLCNGSATEETYTSSSDYIQMKNVIQYTRPNVITFCLGGNIPVTDSELKSQFYDILFKMVRDTIDEVNAADSNANYDPVVIFVPAFTKDIIGVPEAKKYGFTVADVTFIHDLGGVAQESNPYYAFADYPDYDRSMNRDVEFRTHPGDLGHKAIADTIFRAAKDEILKKIPANNDVTTEYDEDYGYLPGFSYTGGEYVEPYIDTYPEDMSAKVKFNGFNVTRIEENGSGYVALLSADGGAGSTGASVSAEDISIDGSAYTKFTVKINVEGAISGKNLVFTYTTASGTKTMTMAIVKGVKTYEFDISDVTETITAVEVTPDMDKCALYIYSMGFKN